MYKELVMTLREAPDDWPDKELHYRAANAIEELSAEVDALKHDIARYVEINTDLLNSLRRGRSLRRVWADRRDECAATPLGYGGSVTLTNGDVNDE